MNEESRRKQVEERVESMIGFYKHLAAYVVVNLMLFFIWLWTYFFDGETFPWFIFPLGGWGIGLLFHFLSAFIWGDFQDWKKKKVEELMEKENN
ncbi:MAG TPA: 2TM domain-containing protein [Euryarchaeota archaeon]|nr:2TM domain-containing protein [Euryarchaeota archaeon]